MQTITTKVLAATNKRPTRVKATAQAGSVTISHDYGTLDNIHEEAALALCRKLGWEGSLVMGTLPNEDNVWVFIPSDRHIIYAHGNKEASHVKA